MIFSCNNKFPERYYKSLDIATGGFNNFSLNLKSNGQFELYICSAKTITVTDSGNTVEMPTKTITGKWTIKNKIIDFKFDKPKSSIDNFFIDTDSKEIFKNKQLLIFSQRLDTAYIYGIPCILTDKK